MLGRGFDGNPTMNPRRFATMAALLCGTVVLAPVENTGAVRPGSSRSPTPNADTVLAVLSHATAMSGVAVNLAVNDDVAPPAEVTRTPELPAIPDKQEAMVLAALPDSSQMLPAGSAAVQAKASTPDLAPNDLKPASSIDIDECFVAESCIDQYLWALYQRTPKADTVKVHERRRATVKRKGKTVTVTRRFTRLVDEDFTWKDPKAAEKAKMPMMDYVIGGMDRGFKLKLFRMLRAAEAAGLSPGITSAFRDNYRQSIASGLKAATDKSYHGGSFRGGYGHGLAADVVSVKGMTQAQRWTSTENLWKWIDIHGKDFGIGRPYLDKDPPHLAPVDGKEYAAHRRGTKARHAISSIKKRNRLAVESAGRTTSSQNNKAEMLFARSEPEMPQSRP